MSPFKRYPCRRYPNDPFDFFGDDFDLFDELDRFFEEMCRSSISFEKISEELVRDGKEGKKHIVHGFCIEMRPDGTTRFHEFGRQPMCQPVVQTNRRGPMIAGEREPVVDIVEGNDEVAVTVDIPGVEREDINLNVTKDTLEITVHKKRYHKHLRLPCLVKPDTMVVTYKNGVLDIVVKKDNKTAECVEQS